MIMVVALVASADPATPPSAKAPAKASAGPSHPADSGTTTPSSPPAGPSPSSRGFEVPQGWTYHADPSGFQIAVPRGWSQSKEGTMVYFREPGGGRALGIDQTRTPRPDPVADWTKQEISRSKRLRDYQRVKIEKVDYFLNCADWEYTYSSSGTRLHVLDRGFITAADRAYAIFWLVPDARWQESLGMFEIFAESFKPAS
ncbi:MAG: hypothetical protein HKP61_05890 [Dactylosporangium sp.]|nr:hypothetical protein [Dactylosporangium sp.]